MSDVLASLSRAVTTASNDDYSEPRSEKRARHVQRLTAMQDAADEIASLRARLAEVEGERDRLREALKWALPLAVDHQNFGRYHVDHDLAKAARAAETAPETQDE